MALELLEGRGEGWTITDAPRPIVHVKRKLSSDELAQFELGGLACHHAP